ncbi:hypothetical protein [Thalassolituus oleivorans]|jgi:hypothetical protein|uniref:hypothetical protein n=1 Tax=Thalassolituus oleivorans TaxID=187493 RepID=UPI0030C89651
MTADVKRPSLPELITFSVRRSLGTILFTLFVIWAMYRGWSLRDENYLTAASGVGYWLGIVGGSMMLLLLLYPVRKHVSAMRNWGKVRYWFFTHMMFGILGPLLILFHSNFSLGSLNSNVALVCMLLVASSGLVGRYFYTKIHYGLYGRKANLEELRDVVLVNRGGLAWAVTIDDGIAARFKQVEEIAKSRPQNVGASFNNWVRYVVTAMWHRFKIKQQLRTTLKKVASDRSWDRSLYKSHLAKAFAQVDSFFAASRRVLEFSFYERLFSLWHVIHLPFFIMLVLSGIVHVVAVHMY